MATPEQTARNYEELAHFYETQHDVQMRDRFLLLAAEATLRAGRTADAERLRSRLLQVAPHNLLKPFGSLAEAMKSADVQNYISGLRRSYPPDKAEQMLAAYRLKPGEARPSPAQTEGLRPPLAKEPAAPSVPHGSGEVYRLKEEAKKGSGPGPALPKERAVLAPAPRRPAASPSPWRNGRVDLVGQEAASGAWVATLLGWVILLAGAGLAAVALAGPFWAHQ
jgi:hypothetical protein